MRIDADTILGNCKNEDFSLTKFRINQVCRGGDHSRARGHRVHPLVASSHQLGGIPVIKNICNPSAQTRRSEIKQNFIESFHAMDS